MSSLPILTCTGCRLSADPAVPISSARATVPRTNVTCIMHLFWERAYGRELVSRCTLPHMLNGFAIVRVSPMTDGEGRD